MSLTGFNRARRLQAERQQAQQQPADPSQVAAAQTNDTAPQQFSLAGQWLSVRASVRDKVGASRLPTGKAEARKWLEQAGYQVQS